MAVASLLHLHPPIKCMAMIGIVALLIEISSTKSNPSIFLPIFCHYFQFLTAYCLLFANFMKMQSKKQSVFTYTGQKKLGIITCSIIFSGILNLTVYFKTSAYATIIWLLFDKTLTVLSKSQTELRSVKYGNPTKWSVQKYGRWPPLKYRQFLSMAVIFYG